MCSGFLVGINAPFGRNRSVKGVVFSFLSHVGVFFRYDLYDPPPSPSRKVCFSTPFCVSIAGCD